MDALAFLHEYRYPLLAFAACAIILAIHYLRQFHFDDAASPENDETYWFGVVATLTLGLVVGYMLFPSYTAFEWTLVVLSLVAGLVSPFFPRLDIQWDKIGAAAVLGLLLSVFGLLVRLSEFDLDPHDVLTLIYPSHVRTPALGYGGLLTVGYCLIAWALGASLASAVARHGFLFIGIAAVAYFFVVDPETLKPRAVDYVVFVVGVIGTLVYVGQSFVRFRRKRAIDGKLPRRHERGL